MAEHVHQAIGEEIRGMSGYYMILEEGVLEYGGREVLYMLGAAAADTSCCGGAGMGFIQVPGYIKALRARRNPDGLWVSDVERVSGEEERREIAKLLKARHPGFLQVNFV
jgi:hypothetical protein